MVLDIGLSTIEIDYSDSILQAKSRLKYENWYVGSGVLHHDFRRSDHHFRRVLKTTITSSVPCNRFPGSFVALTFGSVAKWSRAMFTIGVKGLLQELLCVFSRL